MGAKGVFLGVLGLIVLQVMLSTPGTGSRVGSAFSDSTGFIAKLVDPTVPAFATTASTTPAPSTPAAAAPNPLATTVPPGKTLLPLTPTFA